MTNSKKNIAFLLLTLFLTLKIAGLHALTHKVQDGDVQRCEICDIVTTISFTPLLSVDNKVAVHSEIHSAQERLAINVYKVVNSDDHWSNHLFARPPPTFLNHCSSNSIADQTYFRSDEIVPLQNCRAILSIRSKSGFLHKILYTLSHFKWVS